MVCAARGVVTTGMEANDPEGPCADCAQAAPARSASSEISFDLCGLRIIPDAPMVTHPDSKASAAALLVSVLRLLRCGLRVRRLRVQRFFDRVLDFSLALQS